MEKMKQSYVVATGGCDTSAEIVMRKASKINDSFYDKEEPRQALVRSMSASSQQDKKRKSSAS